MGRTGLISPKKKNLLLYFKAHTVYIHKKAKFALEQAKKAQTGRSIALLLL